MTGTLKQQPFQFNKSTEDGHKSGVPGKTGVPDFFNSNISNSICSFV